MKIEILEEGGAWPHQTKTWSEDAGMAVGAHLKLDKDAEVTILLCDDARIRTLNAQYRGKDKATNVLSWPSRHYVHDEHGTPVPVSDGHTMFFDETLGDLAFGYETCVKESSEIGLENHYKHLTVHGLLHLLGYDHEHDKDAEKMEALEIDILSRLNINNPYEGEGT